LCLDSYSFEAMQPWRRAMGQMIQDSGWRILDELWEQMASLLPPPRPSHPLGCHNPRVPDRAAIEASFFVLRTGSQ
jgi:putative transposase